MRKGEFDLGARLKEIREQRGLTQRDLAKQGGVPHGIISMIERLTLWATQWSSAARSSGESPDNVAGVG